MNYFISFLLFLFILPASALLSPIVRVDLSRCGWQNKALFSGVLLEFQNQHYVVTSSWGQMSSRWTGDRCEKIWSEKGELKVRPIVTDHLAGLAMYAVQTPLEQLSKPVGSNQIVQIWTLNADKLKYFEGDIVVTGSRRHHLPLWDRVTEWQGDRVSSEVIGASVWSGDQWQGLVSHQYLEMIPGAKTKTSKWDFKKDLLHDHLIVIPAEHIWSWFQQQILHPVEPVLWQPEDQQIGLDRWIVGDLEFHTRCPENSNPDPDGEYPIGGNDGFGIGGDSILNKACKTQVALSQKDQSPWISSSFQEWKKQSQQALEQKQVIFLWYGLSRSPQGMIRDYIFSTESLIKMSLDPNKKWVDQTPALSPPTYLENFVQSAKILQNQSLHCYQQLFIKESSIQELIRRLFFLALIGQSQVWSELRLEDVSTTMDRTGIYAEGWKALEWSQTCNSPKFRSIAEEFSNEYQKIDKP